MLDSSPLVFWITYAWADNSRGDFSYLVQELATIGVQARFDRIALVPGRDLWEQIGDQITSSAIDGWGYLLSEDSLASEACREELAYALGRAINTKGRAFPLIGLLHGVPVEDVPPALRVRLCVNLASTSWKDEVRSALLDRAPELSQDPQTRFIWTMHPNYSGNPRQTAIEVRPRFGEVMYWRFAVPVGTVVVRFSHGPADGGALSDLQTMVVEGGIGDIGSTQMAWFGAGDKLTQGTSAYVVVEGNVPEMVAFSPASDVYGPPINVEVWRPRK